MERYLSENEQDRCIIDLVQIKRSPVQESGPVDLGKKKKMSKGRIPATSSLPVNDFWISYPLKSKRVGRNMELIGGWSCYCISACGRSHIFGMY